MEKMDKKTKIEIILLVVIAIFIIDIICLIVINPFGGNKENNIEMLNTQIDEELNNEDNNELNNEEINNEEQNNEEENFVEEENIENSATVEENSQTSTSSSSNNNANNSNEEKAIELVKQKWGSDDTVYFDLAGVTADGQYRVSVNRDAKVLAWYIVDIDTGSVTQK